MSEEDINILDYKELNLEDIYFSHPKKLKGGSYISEAFHKDSNNNTQRIFVQTPRLLNTTGIVKNDSRCYIELELDQTHYPFFKFITDLDDHNIINIQKNSLTWFNKHFPLDVVEEFYKTPIKVGKNKSPPKLKLKIPVSKNSIVCNIYDESKNIIDFTSVKKSSKVICVMEFIGLRFLKQQVLCEWNPVQIKLCDTVKISTPKYIINEDLLTDDEEDVQETVQLQESPENSETSPENQTEPEPQIQTEQNDTVVEEPHLDEESLNLEPDVEETKEVLQTPNEVQDTVDLVNENEPTENVELVIEELPDSELSLDDVEYENINEKTEIEDAIVEEIKNEIENSQSNTEENLNLLEDINEKKDEYNELLNTQGLLKKAQEELELIKKMSNEKDEKINALKNQFKEFVQNLD